MDAHDPMGITEPTFVMAADANFAMQLAVALQSLALAHTEYRCSVFVLSVGFDGDLRDRVTSGLPSRVTVTWVDATSSAIEAANRPAFLPPASLFRLRVASLLPPSIEQAVYLDADLIVRRPLAALSGLHLGSVMLAAVQDPMIPWCGAPGGLPWRELGLPPSTPYFNAGVLVIPLDVWRRERVEERALALMGTYSFPLADQCTLNAVVAGSWAKVDPLWNLQSGHLHARSLAAVVEEADALDHALDDPSVVHFTNVSKRPWQPGCQHPYRDEWLALLRLTSWAGWVPRRGRERTIAGVKARSRNVLRALRGASFGA